MVSEREVEGDVVRMEVGVEGGRREGVEVDRVWLDDVGVEGVDRERVKCGRRVEE